MVRAEILDVPGGSGQGYRYPAKFTSFLTKMSCLVGPKSPLGQGGTLIGMQVIRGFAQQPDGPSINHETSVIIVTPDLNPSDRKQKARCPSAPTLRGSR
jgi:hypothetical protein